MGAKTRAKERPGPRLGRGRIALALCLAAASIAVAAQPASAAFHEILIREVYAGGASDDSYVVLQAYSPGQNAVGGHSVVAYGPGASGQLGTFSFPDSVPNGANQMTILVADSNYATGFPAGPSPNGTMASLNLDPSGGAVCWDGTPDCVSWGAFAGTTTSPAGVPAVAMGAGQALHRSIAAGCPTLLQAGDDTNQSAEDFSPQAPNPRNNASAITETTCSAQPPTAAIDAKPALRTQSTSADFTFHSTPPGAEFECKLDSGAFEPCNSGSKSYAGPLAEASHTFQVKAKNANGTGAPASYTWAVDLTGPTTTINSPTPPTPNSGTSLTFKFSASESGSTFECSLAKGIDPDSFSGCLGSGKTYVGLTDGSYTFKVHATDQAGNEGPNASFPFTVDTTLADTTPPETSILSGPPNPSDSATASFAYASNEPGSSFECRLDTGAFAACPAAGISYSGLANGAHSFQVRATDQEGNTDPTPAGFSWDVAVPSPLQPPPVIPPGAAPTPPETTITGRPGAATRDRTPTLRFHSSTPGASFECKVDAGAFRACASPFTTKPLSFGRHTVLVRAVAAGLVDASPAKSSFKVLKRKRKRQR